MSKHNHIVEIASAVAIIVLVVAASTLLLAIYWGIVFYLQDYGNNITPLPFADKTQVLARPLHTYLPGTFFGFCESIIDWYNMSFHGATRFGSGLGMIIGPLLSLCMIKNFGSPARAVAGAIAGGIIGSRSILMITSGVSPFLTGLMLGSIIGTLWQIHRNSHKQVPKLPELALSSNT